MRPVPNHREIRMVFPDRYTRHDEQTSVPKGEAPLVFIVGFSGNLLLSNPRFPPDNEAAAMRNTRVEFVRDVLMRLPRELPGVRLSPRTTREAGQERLAIDAFDSEGLAASLVADSGTCAPVALQYRRGSVSYRVDLSEYRLFGRIHFPTMLKESRNGEPTQTEVDSDVQVNAPRSDEYFRQ
jgi:hypothetical protein